MTGLYYDHVEAIAIIFKSTQSNAQMQIKSTSEVILVGTLEYSVRPDDCTWVISQDASTVQISLTKTHEGMFGVVGIHTRIHTYRASVEDISQGAC